MKIFTITSWIAVVCYIALFVYVFLDPYVFYPLMCLFGFIVFFCQTIISLILYINIQDSIEYNEYKFNERRESAVLEELV